MGACYNASERYTYQQASIMSPLLIAPGAIHDRSVVELRMSAPQLSLSLQEALTIVAVGSALLALCRWLDIDPWVAIACSLYLMASLVLLLLGRGQ